MRVEIPPKLIPVFAPKHGAVRWRCAYGGRGSGKSFTFAKMAALRGAVQKMRILCTREFQGSIKESFHAELKNAILSDEWLSSQYDVGIDYLRHKHNGTEFLFKGLRHNMSSVKSTAQVDICIVEEAEDIPSSSWIDLIPTIRAPNSEIWVIWNPKNKESWVNKNILDGGGLPRSVVAEVNWRDNPWFPKELNETRLNDRLKMDPALYRHVWEGAFWEMSDAQIFRGRYRVADFDVGDGWNGPYFGLDFGFANDPTAGVKLWINDRKLYIEHELYRTGLDIDKTPSAMIAALPGCDKNTVVCDSARPESISYIRRNGISRAVACEKGKGSIEDGLEFIKSFDEIVIHTRCKHTRKEFDLYSYKVDKYTKEPVNEIQDAHNHAIDAIRYALERIMKRRKVSF